MRFSAPIFTYKNILEKAGIYLKANPIEQGQNPENSDDILSEVQTFGQGNESNSSENVYAATNITELHKMLDEAVNNEDYEKAAKIRDEISKR